MKFARQMAFDGNELQLQMRRAVRRSLLSLPSLVLYATAKVIDELARAQGLDLTRFRMGS